MSSLVRGRPPAKVKPLWRRSMVALPFGDEAINDRPANVHRRRNAGRPDSAARRPGAARAEDVPDRMARRSAPPMDTGKCLSRECESEAGSRGRTSPSSACTRTARASAFPHSPPSWCGATSTSSSRGERRRRQPPATPPPQSRLSSSTPVIRSAPASWPTSRGRVATSRVWAASLPGYRPRRWSC